jgi:hypothetical protein
MVRLAFLFVPNSEVNGALSVPHFRLHFYVTPLLFAPSYLPPRQDYLTACR